MEKLSVTIGGSVTNQFNTLKEKISEAIELFNRYRFPEASVELVKISKNTFEVKFKGPFRQTCGFHDYFEDLLVFLEDVGLTAETKKIEEKDSFCKVTFQVKRQK